MAQVWWSLILFRTCTQGAPRVIDLFLTWDSVPVRHSELNHSVHHGSKRREKKVFDIEENTTTCENQEGDQSPCQAEVFTVQAQIVTQVLQSCCRVLH